MRSHLDSDTFECRPLAFIIHVSGRGHEEDTKVAELSLGGCDRLGWGEETTESGLIFDLLSLRGFSHS